MTPDQIKQLRGELGWTARQLGEALGVDQKTVLEWESGQRFPTKRHVQAMVRVRDKGRPSAATPAPRPRLGTSDPLATLAQPEFWTLIRKLVLHQTLREELARLAASYPDSPDD